MKKIIFLLFFCNYLFSQVVQQYDNQTENYYNTYGLYTIDDINGKPIYVVSNDSLGLYEDAISYSENETYPFEINGEKYGREDFWKLMSDLGLKVYPYNLLKFCTSNFVLKLLSNLFIVKLICARN